MRRLPGPVAVLALSVALVAPRAVAQEEGSDAAASSDTTRTFVSTDGSIVVYQELRPGEGIDGYFWVYDAEADLERLTDDDLRNEPLDPLTDEFGFVIVAPESILALRDSVAAVADSILAERIEVRTDFEPKLKSVYDEKKDAFSFTNDFDAAVPMTNRGSVAVKVASDLTYNEASGRAVDGRQLSATFTYRYRPEITATASISRSDDLQQRNEIVDSDRNNTNVTVNLRAGRSLGRWKLDASGGGSVGRLNYVTPSLDGNSRSFTPNWSAKLTRAHTGGQLSFNYTGNVGQSSRLESRRGVVPDTLDAGGDPVFEITTTDASESNYNHSLKANFDHTFNPDWKFTLNGGASTGQFQFLSQETGFEGQQETRVQSNQSVKSTFNGKPSERLEFRWKGDLNRNENLFDLDQGREKVNTTTSTNLDLDYSLWAGGDLLVKTLAKREDKNLNTLQSGIVDGYQVSTEYKQTITQRVSFDATYFVTLDRFAFDDPDSNKGDRDLLNQRSTFIVRYTPRDALKTDVTMEVRENQTINIHRSQSGNNKTDYTYLIKPTYTWTVGDASLSGEFTADVRYAVFDFAEDNNTLIRRFSTRQRWAHKFSDRFSTNLLWTYEMSDQGSYTRASDGIRRYARSLEQIRRRLETEVLYRPRGFLEARVLYRWDGDDNYRVVAGQSIYAGARRTEEFTYGVKFNKKYFKNHVVAAINFSHTLKNGDTVGAFDSNFYTIRASIDYQPFKKKKKNGDQGGSDS